MRYKLPFLESIGAGSTVKTLVGLTVPDVVGNRFRLRRISMGGADSPFDTSVRIRVQRILDLSAGSAGSATAKTPSKVDPGSVASIVTGTVNYTAEPTTYEANEVWASGVNHRGTIISGWDELDAPVFLQDQFCGIIVFTNGTVKQMIGCAEFDVF